MSRRYNGSTAEDLGEILNNMNGSLRDGTRDYVAKLYKNFIEENTNCRFSIEKDSPFFFVKFTASEGGNPPEEYTVYPSQIWDKRSRLRVYAEESI